MFGWGRKQEVKAEADAFESGVAMPESWLFELFGAGTPTESGEAIGPETALRVPAVLSATRAISETLASLPVHLFRRGPNGSRERERDHPAAKALERPNPWTSPYELKLRLVQDAIRHGRGLAIAARGGAKIELHNAHPGSIAVLHDGYGEPSYKLTSGTNERSYSWRDVVDLVPIPNPNGQPISIISAAREAIGLAATLQRHGSRLFGNGARPSGLLTFAEKLNSVEVTNYRKLWQAAHGGRRSGGTAVMDRGANYVPLTLTSVDAQFVELWRLVILEIARAFRVPPHMLAEMERATHANSEELGLQFVSYCLRPWADLLEGALSRVLLTEEERDVLFIEVGFDDLVKGNVLARMEALSKAVAGGIRTPDEARAIDNFPPVEGGDKIRVPLNTVQPGTARDTEAAIDNAKPEPPAGKPKLSAVA